MRVHGEERRRGDWRRLGHKSRLGDSQETARSVVVGQEEERRAVLSTRAVDRVGRGGMAVGVFKRVRVSLSRKNEGSLAAAEGHVSVVGFTLDGVMVEGGQREGKEQAEEQRQVRRMVAARASSPLEQTNHDSILLQA